MTWRQYFKWKDPCKNCLVFSVCDKNCEKKNLFTYMKPDVKKEKLKTLYFDSVLYFAAFSVGVTIAILVL